MSVTLFEYNGGEVTNTETQAVIAYYDTDGSGNLDSDELARLEEDILSEEAYLDQAAATYVWLTSTGTYFDWVYAPDATFIEENSGAINELTLAAMSYWGQTTGQTIAYDNYVAFLESSGLADTTGLRSEIEDFLSQFEDSDTVDEEDDDEDEVVSGQFSEIFPEIAPALISMGHAGLVLVLLGGIIIKDAVNDVVEAGTDVYGELIGELEDKVDEVGDMDPESLTIQLDLQVLSNEISAINTATTTLANILQTLLEIPDILVQAGFSSEKSSLDTQSFVAQTS